MRQRDLGSVLIVAHGAYSQTVLADPLDPSHRHSHDRPAPDQSPGSVNAALVELLRERGIEIEAAVDAWGSDLPADEEWRLVEVEPVGPSFGPPSEREDELLRACRDEIEASAPSPTSGEPPAQASSRTGRLAVERGREEATLWTLASAIAAGSARHPVDGVLEALIEALGASGGVAWTIHNGDPQVLSWNGPVNLLHQEVTARLASLAIELSRSVLFALERDGGGGQAAHGLVAPIPGASPSAGALTILRGPGEPALDADDAALACVATSQLGIVLGGSGFVWDVREDRLHAQRLEMIGRMASSVAHDLNNMLQVVHGYAGFLAEEVSSDSLLAGDVQEIRSASGRAIELARALLGLSRMESTPDDPIDVNGIIFGAKRLLERVAGEGVSLRTQLHHGPLRSRIDPVHLEQALVNLVANGRDAMAGQGTLTILTERRALSELSPTRVQADGDYATIAISDTGTGIQAENLKRIFEPFFTTKEKGQGTGLGLAAVADIVHTAGGFIDINTTIGKGTTLNVYLPTLDD